MKVSGSCVCGCILSIDVGPGGHPGVAQCPECDSLLEILPVCQWFGACQNVAVGEQSHPVLGSVPICDRCRKLATSTIDDRMSGFRQTVADAKTFERGVAE